MSRALAVLALALALAAPAYAAAPRASVPDIEDEVMCLECGTALNVSNSEVADQERDFIAELVAQGKTKPEIKDALVNEYGPRVLAMPDDKGFGLANWLVPLAVSLAAMALVVFTARRWRRRRAAPATAGAAAGPELDPDDARRLDAELAAYDK